MNKISREMNSSDYRVRNIHGKCHAIVFHDDTVICMISFDNIKKQEYLVFQCFL